MLKLRLSPRPTTLRIPSLWMSSTETTQDLLLRLGTLAGNPTHQQTLTVTMTQTIPDGMTMDKGTVVVVVVTTRINLEVISLATSRVMAQMILMMVTKVVMVDDLEMDLVARLEMDLVVPLVATQALLVTVEVMVVTTETRVKTAWLRPISLALD